MEIIAVAAVEEKLPLKEVDEHHPVEQNGGVPAPIALVSDAFDQFQEGEVLVLGHTHYPMIQRRAGRGLLINAGSVGQPRDGDTRASWVLLEPGCLTARVIRVEYDRQEAIRQLRLMRWEQRSIAALQKDRRGPMGTAPLQETANRLQSCQTTL